MTIALKQDNIITEIGPGGILHSLFSTVACRLESGVWGSKYPVIMMKLYQGRIDEGDVNSALSEMKDIKNGLALLHPDQVVWDIENLNQQPPWGSAIGGHVRSLENYYVTTSGRNLVDEIIDNLEALKEFGGDLEIISYQGGAPVL